MKNLIQFLFLLSVHVSLAQTATINWNTIDGQVPNKMFGLNIWDGTLNGINNDLAYKSAIADLNLSIVRFHAYELTENNNPKSWYNTNTQQWRTAVIDGCLQAQNSPNKFISIFNFPQWLSYNGADVKKMNVANAQIYADWCANLVQITNIQLGHNVKYWTVFNELESNYDSNIQDLATIYLACYAKMKLIDPTIKIGAFAIAQPWWNNGAQTAFYQTTKDNLDFIDYHLYGTEFSSNSNASFYNDANYLGYGGVDNVRNLANAAGVSPNVPIWLSESNIVYSYTNDPAGKMATNVGAVWDALLFESAIKGQAISSIMLFNDRDGVYGKLASNNDKRPAYHNLKILSNNFYGQVVNSVTSDQFVKILAVKNNSNYSLMIINKGAFSKNVNINFTNGPTNGTSCNKINLKNTITEATSTWTNGNALSIPGESIVYLLFGANLSSENFKKSTSDLSIENSVIRNQKINLKSNENFIAKIIFNDLNGKKIIETTQLLFNDEINDVDISKFNLSKGFYLMNVLSDEKILKTFKIIIK